MTELNRNQIQVQRAKRWLIYGMHSILTVGVVVLLNVVTSDFSYRWDVSEIGAHSPTSGTRQLLKRLENPVSIYFFRRPPREEEGRHTNANRRMLIRFLKDLAQRSKNLSVNVLSTTSDGKRIRRIADQFERDAERLKRKEPVLVTVEDLNRLIPFHRFHRRAPGTLRSNRDRTVSYALVEHHVSSAIRGLTRNRDVSIYFTAGSGEPTAKKGAGNQPRAVSVLAGRLRVGEGFRVASVNLNEREAVPQDCDVLITIGPRRDVTSRARRAVEEYLKRGGSWMYLTEPAVPSEFDQLITRFPLEVTGSKLLDSDHQVPQVDGAIRLDSFSSHPITEPLIQAGLSVFVLGAAIVRTKGKGPEKEREEVTPLLSSGPTAGTEEAVSTSGGHRPPLSGRRSGRPVASAWKQPDDGKQRFVLAGDSDFVTNRILRQTHRVRGGGNMDFVVNAIRWLAGLEEEIQVDPRGEDRSVLPVTKKQSSDVFSLVVVLVPGIVLLSGLSFFWYRRLLQE